MESIPKGNQSVFEEIFDKSVKHILDVKSDQDICFLIVYAVYGIAQHD
jgi:hypothetical protein